MCSYDCERIVYRATVETVYNNLFKCLPFLPVRVRRRVARWITDRLVPADVPSCF
jgi:hypothetical protein